MPFLTLLPILLQGATALTPLIGALSPTLAAVVPSLTAAAAGTGTAKTASSGVAATAAIPVPGAATLIQEMLVGAGHAVTVDGIIGSQTLAAIDAWAEPALGIVPGGMVSLMLRDVLKKL